MKSTKMEGSDQMEQRRKKNTREKSKETPPDVQLLAQRYQVRGKSIASSLFKICVQTCQMDVEKYI